MSALVPLETFFDAGVDPDLPLPPELARLYGRLSLRLDPDQPPVLGNFVTTLDGVVSLGVPGKGGGGPISGFNAHDRMVMGLLRAVADAVIVGAGTVKEARDHLWTAAHIYPPLAGAYDRLRSALGKSGPPLHVIVTAHGELDLEQRVFRSGEVPVLIVTTTRGAARGPMSRLPSSVGVVTAPGDETISAGAILTAVAAARACQVILSEGGPRLIGDFLGERRLSDLFLTLAPQIAGRDDSVKRPGLVAGRTFAPENPLWGTLVGIKRGESHLFMRYSFERDGRE